jgi:hypothetical protein
MIKGWLVRGVSAYKKRDTPSAPVRATWECKMPYGRYDLSRGQTDQALGRE